MATPELIQSWARTEAFLREARTALPADVAAEFSSQLEQFVEFLAHNELSLAFDTLLGIVEDAHCAVPPLIQPLLLAASNMGLEQQRQSLAKQLASLTN
ncbi:hypothetical protein ACIPRI_15840 [Variovorax sp. LARHSF232]